MAEAMKQNQNKIHLLAVAIKSRNWNKNSAMHLRPDGFNGNYQILFLANASNRFPFEQINQFR